MLPEGNDMSGLLAQAQAMQSQMMQAQEELAATTVEGTAGGGLVTARMSATGELQSLDISPEACDPADTESLADLVVAAIRDASARGQEVAATKLGPMAGGLGL